MKLALHFFLLKISFFLYWELSLVTPSSPDFLKGRLDGDLGLVWPQMT
jgi:hypothetical protein